MRQNSVLSVLCQEYSNRWQRIFKILPVSLILMGLFAQSHAQMIVNIEYNPPKCFGYGTADATALVNGGIAPYTYQWSNGATSPTAFGLNLGYTAVTITDASGQQASSSVNITPNPELVVNLTGGGDDCYQGNTDLTAQSLGGVPPYTFQWSTGHTEQTLPSPPAGYHFVTVTDANGCFDVQGKNVAGAMEAHITTNEVSCFGACDGSIGATVTGGVGPYAYQWDNGLYQSAPIQVVADVWVYNITITDANGCTTVGSAELTQPPLIEPTVELENPCSGTTAATVSAIGGVPPYTFKWSNGHFGATHPYLTEGQHQVTITDSSTNCHVSTSFWVTNSDMALSVDKQAADCFGGSTGSATANVTGGSGNYTFEWSNGQDGITATDLAPGMHKVTATDAGGCVKEMEFEIVSSTGLEAEVFPTMVDCFGNAGTANAAVTGGTPPYTFGWSNGQNQQMATNLPEGTYSIVITDTHGCTGEAQVEIEDLNDMDVSLVQTTSSLCDATGGSATVNVTGGVAPYTYKWNGQWTAEPTKENLTAGANTLSVFDVNGCEEIIEFDILDESMQTNVSAINEGCPGESNGTAEAQIMSGGVAPFTFQWSNGTTSQMAENLPVGWHSVIITDAMGCSESMDIEVEPVEEMQIAVDINPTACEGIASGSAHAVVSSGGTAPYSFNWSNAAQSDVIGGLEKGEYILTVTDANGCAKEVMIEVEEEPIDVALNITSPVCANDNDGSVQASIISGGTAPYSFNWSNGSTGAIADNFTAGSHTLMITDANGCEEEIPFDVESSTTLTAEFIYGTADCNDNGVLVAFTDMSAGASQGTTPVSWAWTFSDGQTSNDQNPQIWVNNSNITAELTVTNDLGCTEVMAQAVEVEVIDVALAPDHKVCHNETVSIEITVNNNANDLVYDWAPDNMIISGDGTPNPVIATNQIGQYDLQVTIQNGTGCVKEETVSVTVEEIVEMNPALIDYQQCNSLTVDFSNASIADVECVWYFDYPNNMDANSTEVNPSYTYSEPGEYTVALLPSDNCHEPLLLPITVTTAPEVAIASAADNCQTEVEVQFTNLTNIDGDVQSFVWDFGSLGTSTEENPMMTFTEDQTIEATFTVEFGNGCVVSVNETVQVNVFNPPTLEDQWFSCNGQEVALNPSVSGDFNFHWNAPSTAVISSTTAANPTVNVNETTVFSVTITGADNSDGCESIQFVTVEVPPTILAIEEIEDVKLCDDADVTLAANVSGIANVQWSTDPDFSNIISTEVSITVTAGDPINYYVMATSADGCEVSESALVGNFSSDLNVNASQEICQGYYLEWNSPDIDPADIMAWQPYNPLTTPVTESETFTFSMDIGEDCPAYGTFELSVTPFEFTHIIDAEPAELLQGEWTQLNVTQHPDYAYQWSPANGLSSTTIANPSAQPLQTTEYKVHVTDIETGCEGEAKIQIKVEDVVCEEPYIFVPNAFTPNEDGVNDKLFVRGFNIDEVYFAVYDRWGEMVFETTDLDKGWDGSFKGTTVSGDVYGYYLKAVCYGGEKFFKKGNVTVLR